MSDHAQQPHPSGLQPQTTPLIGSQAGHGEHDAHGLHGGLAKYIYVFVALCVLTGASFFTYSQYWPFHDQPEIGRTFMMAVSCTKAMLVILFFMHVKDEANWKYVLTVPAAMMSVFLVVALVPDIGMRDRRVSEERRLYMAEEPHEETSSDTPHATPPAKRAGGDAHSKH